MSTFAHQLLGERLIDIGATLSWYRHGGADPTTWLNVVGRGVASRGEMVRATRTPDGPGTLRIGWTGSPVTDVDGIDGVSLEAYGPGAAWMLEQAPRMLGVDDGTDHGLAADDHPAVARAARNGRSVRMGASGDLYHSLLPTILEQRITIGEARHQWRQLCCNLSEPAPGPFTRLLLPPEPGVLARQPSWWFHPLGIERKRAEPLLRVAQHAAKFWDWAALTPSETRAKLHLMDGIGQWTIGNVLGPALGDPDAVAVGDYHLKNMVGSVLAGEARATDERMLELLEPYVGQRGRVVRLLRLNSAAAPKFGPKKRILPMHTW